jgi:hypothetical protein
MVNSNQPKALSDGPTDKRKKTLRLDLEKPRADPVSNYIDFFSDGHLNMTPKILPGDGTDIAWPADWTELEAAIWRVAHDLARGSSKRRSPSKG